MGFPKGTSLSCIEVAAHFTSGLETLSCNCSRSCGGVDVGGVQI